MAEVGTVTVKVIPDFSAFRAAGLYDVVAVIAAELPELTIAQVQSVTDEILKRFVLFPSTGEADER